MKDKNARMPYEKRIRSRPLCRLPEPMAHTRLLRCGSSLPKKNLSVRRPWKYRPFRHRPQTPRESWRCSFENRCANLPGEGFESAMRFQSVSVGYRRWGRGLPAVVLLQQVAWTGRFASLPLGHNQKHRLRAARNHPLLPVWRREPQRSSSPDSARRPPHPPDGSLVGVWTQCQNLPRTKLPAQTIALALKSFLRPAGLLCRDRA